ncbi:hypothetical protein U472_05510 [Orenia metallireducens]|jgi:NAD+ diphosphatase|uniref:NAD(+) diphosphatase n=1 Tax=Orenia metallireducens TaxID=1413210 RepID=A0A1C0A9J5_9FIRM|nr:NAD(+) diphosphatase [Orenia metallireducens]OCL26945.1 hypothetical protein U472_05510 [Orenia metallireducens]
MEFKSLTIPISNKLDSAYWLLFSENQILLKFDNNTPAIPHINNRFVDNLKPIVTEFLGTLDGVPCYVGLLDSPNELLNCLSFYRIRELYGMIDEDLFRLIGYGHQFINWSHDSQYCGRCGNPTENLKREKAKICSECNQIIFPRISPAIIVAITRGSEILLANSHRFSNKLYSVIAGFVEPGETLEECVRREVKEEVGLEIKNIEYFGSQFWPFPDSLMVAYRAEYASGEIVIDDKEIADAQWFNVDNLPQIPDKVSIARWLIDDFVENNS